MIKFFRKIRQNLISQNKLSKYLLYALGEIVLVMIGILLALQVNTWNENRTTKIRELSYLNGIKSDLLNDIASLDRYIKVRNNKIVSARKIIDHIEGNPIEDYIILNNLIYDIVGSAHFKEANITFDELKSSGNLNIISNDSIKNILLQLQSNYDINEASRAHELFDYHNYVSIPYFNTVDLHPSLLLMENSEKKGTVKKEQIDQLLEIVAFKNGCVNAIWMSKIHLARFSIIKNLSIDAINLIDKELE